jgi:hypothetical protein
MGQFKKKNPRRFITIFRIYNSKTSSNYFILVFGFQKKLLHTYYLLSGTVQNLICWDTNAARTNFTFNRNEGFVDYVKAYYQGPRKWFNLSVSSWNGEKVDFAETFNQNGIGFTFNMIDAEKWINFNT